MAYSQIMVKNPTPKDRDDSIAVTSVITFDLVSGDVPIDLSTLKITIILRGGLTNRTLTKTYEYATANQQNITGKGTPVDGYAVRFDPYPAFPKKFESRQDVELRIDCSDTNGLAMRQTRINYRAIDVGQVDAFSDLIKEVTEIFQNREQGRINRGGKLVDFTYRNWSSVPELAPKVYKNGMEQEDDKYILQYTDGKLKFGPDVDVTHSPLRWHDPIDTIEADYYFSVISDVQMVSFLRVALAEYNAFRPHTSYTLSTAPTWALGAILIGAAYNSLNNILMGFGNQQAQQKYGDSWKEIMSGLQNQRDSYKDLFIKMLEEKKYNLASPVSITIPEYTLPGGRSRYFRYLYKGGESGS